MKQSVLIIIPPLGVDSYKMGEKFTRDWPRDLQMEVINWPFFWEKDGGSYEARLKRLTDKIEDLIQDDMRVSLLGLSAGGSVAINAFSEKKDGIDSVVNVGGRLRSGEVVFPKSKSENDNNFLFRESVERCEKNIEGLASADKRKILTVRPLWDEFAPINFATISGANNIQNIAFEHILGIILAMTAYKNKIFSFIKSNRNSA